MSYIWPQKNALLLAKGEADHNLKSLLTLVTFFVVKIQHSLKASKKSDMSTTKRIRNPSSKLIESLEADDIDSDMPKLDTFAGVSKRMKISNGKIKSIELNARRAKLINESSLNQDPLM